ncbi:hypothetical protein D3C78_1118460 [compost metagenome]
MFAGSQGLGGAFHGRCSRVPLGGLQRRHIGLAMRQESAQAGGHGSDRRALAREPEGDLHRSVHGLVGARKTIPMGRIPQRQPVALIRRHPQMQVCAQACHAPGRIVDQQAELAGKGGHGLARQRLGAQALDRRRRQPLRQDMGGVPGAIQRRAMHCWRPIGVRIGRHQPGRDQLRA